MRAADPLSPHFSPKRYYAGAYPHVAGTSHPRRLCDVGATTPPRGKGTKHLPRTDLRRLATRFGE
ncbi:MAG: hypothetical protein CME06_17240 [Gemmatimonadetes bacterium]|nr:hypothetical protein [Gemmatimonadota bacterium]